MKKIQFILTALVFLSALSLPALAASAEGTTSGSKRDFEVDGALLLGSGPSGFDSGYGLNAGVGYTLGDIDKNLQARVDISYSHFTKDYFGQTLNYNRNPFDISARYYFPIDDRLRLFAQAGVEASFDKQDYPIGFFKQSKSQLNLGLTPAGGVEFSIIPEVSVFAMGMYHIISDNYFTMHIGAAFHF